MSCFTISPSVAIYDDIDAQHVIISGRTNDEGISGKVFDCNNEKKMKKPSESNMELEQTANLGARYFSTGMNLGSLLWAATERIWWHLFNRWSLRDIVEPVLLVDWLQSIPGGRMCFFKLATLSHFTIISFYTHTLLWLLSPCLYRSLNILVSPNASRWIVWDQRIF